ncbi:hypothetical protein [Mesorhizobium sp. M1328]
MTRMTPVPLAAIERMSFTRSVMTASLLHRSTFDTDIGRPR